MKYHALQRSQNTAQWRHVIHTFKKLPAIADCVRLTSHQHEPDVTPCQGIFPPLGR